jgi:16S rRNA (guanine1207-N2)-methyltransferase
MSQRLTLALTGGGLVLPADGTIAVFGPRGDADLSDLSPARTLIIQPLQPDHDALTATGFTCVPDLSAHKSDFCAAIICLPRAKAHARSLLAAAARVTKGPLIVDGLKTDGIDSLLKEIRKRTDVSGPVSKAHGKLFWLDSAAVDWADWSAVATKNPDGFITAPGVFSADGIDPASAMLAQHLPLKLGKSVADLGAGWGYLSARILERSDITALHLVEANNDALACARLNLTDPRARFHWADATTWAPSTKVDTVVMNPPFHTERRADPALGRAFVRAAAQMLAPNGHLWMVANRHLAYEAALSESFTMVEEVAGDNRFKILQAQRPTRPRR